MKGGTRWVKFSGGCAPFDLERPNSAGLYMWEGHISGVSYALRKGRGTSATQFWVHLYVCIYSLTQNKSEVATHMGNGIVLVAKHGPALKGRVSSSPQIWGPFLFTHTPFVAELYQTLRGNIWGRACILGTSTPPIPRERSFSDHQFWGSPFYAYILQRRTTM